MWYCEKCNKPVIMLTNGLCEPCDPVAQLRADLARVTAERDGLQKGLNSLLTHSKNVEKGRDEAIARAENAEAIVKEVKTLLYRHPETWGDDQIGQSLCVALGYADYAEKIGFDVVNNADPYGLVVSQRDAAEALLLRIWNDAFDIQNNVWPEGSWPDDLGALLRARGLLKPDE